MYGKSDMETYITVCKIANWNLPYDSGNSNRALYQQRGVAWGGRREVGSKGRGCMYTCGCGLLV